MPGDKMSELRAIWLKFFQDAGIPKGLDEKYAEAFEENRISKDMLPELTKWYLRDMNIICIGDIIAILRHAKKVHEKEIKETKEGASNKKRKRGESDEEERSNGTESEDDEYPSQRMAARKFGSWID